MDERPGKKLLSAVAIGYEMVGAAFDAFSTAPGGWDYTNLSASARPPPSQDC